MGTRSRIGIMHEGVCKSIYCHWDGYLEHNGAILQEYYDHDKTIQLIAHGDMSSLAPEIDAGRDNHSFNQPKAGVCVFYGRDRGETDIDWEIDSTFEEFLKRVDRCCAEWYYIMKDGVWYVGNVYERDPKFYNQLVPLSEALETVKEAA